METSNQINPRLGLKLALLLSILTVILLGIYFVNVGYLAGNGEEETVLTSDAEPSEPEEPSAIGPNCRYGIAPTSQAHFSWLDDFGVGWYLTFGASAKPAGNFAEFVPLIRTPQDKIGEIPNRKRLPTYKVIPDFPELKSHIQQRPGALWIVGNEVERLQLQDDIMPDLYAEAYHEVYHFIKKTDPTAQVAISALVEVTPGRLQYLDMVWNAYWQKYGTTIPVDVWNMHLYVLPERKWGTTVGAFAHIANGTDPNLAKYDSSDQRRPILCSRDDVYCFAEHDDMGIFAEQVRSMRKWMKDHGQQNKPLIISEYSILWPYVDDGGKCFRDEEGNCFTPSRVIKFMDSSFNYLENAKDPNLGYPLDENRLVQQWLWYSTWVDQESGFGGGSSNLLNDAQSAMSAIGVNFRDEVTARSLKTNLFPVNPFWGSASTNGNSTADATLSVGVMNNGNHVTADDIKVTFYSDEARTNVIGTAVIPRPSEYDAGMVGCARKTIRVEVQWPNLSQGKHYYWVKVNSDDSIPETNPNDNVASGWVYVDPPYQLYIPSNSK